MAKKSVKKAVIPVAGLGTRFLPVTKSIPKELLPIVDKPVIQFVVEEAVAAGIKEIIFVTSDNKTAIETYFAKDQLLERFLEEKHKKKALEAVRQPAKLAKFIFVHQDEPLGLGHAVLQAAPVVGDEPFLVLGGDDVVESKIPASRQLIEEYKKLNATIIGVTKVAPTHTERYGIIDPKETISPSVVRIRDIMEKPIPENAPSLLGVGGRWLLTPEIFEFLERNIPGAGGEFQLTDAIRIMIDHQPIYAKTYEGVYRDCGNKIEYLKTVLSFALKRDDIGEELRDYIKTLQLNPLKNQNVHPVPHVVQGKAQKKYEKK